MAWASTRAGHLEVPLFRALAGTAERCMGDDMDAFSRVHAHVRARRAWWRLRIVWGVRSLLFAWHERHATTPDQMDMAAELAAATEGMY